MQGVVELLVTSQSWSWSDLEYLERVGDVIFPLLKENGIQIPKPGVARQGCGQSLLAPQDDGARATGGGLIWIGLRPFTQPAFVQQIGGEESYPAPCNQAIARKRTAELGLPNPCRQVVSQQTRRISPSG